MPALRNTFSKPPSSQNLGTIKNAMHRAISAMLWFEKVRRGSMYLNHPDLVQKHAAHLASPVKLSLKPFYVASYTPGPLL